MNSGFPDNQNGVDGAPLPVFGVVTTDPDLRSEAAFVDYEKSFRGAMSSYHMEEADIDCMVEQVFPDPPPEAGSVKLAWTSEELNAFAAECDIDFSELYYYVGD
jgi:hypothetical protein